MVYKTFINSFSCHPEFATADEGSLILKFVANINYKGFFATLRMTNTLNFKLFGMPKLALIILDGFGINDFAPSENAIKLAHTPIFDMLFSNPYAKLDASGKAV